ncbi:hypothetical protein B0H63DRAFT_462827 [Podospora didyma]|uniref:Uncharacterized protein n=1 Tax=Podospora didyma TaxID=330526 RepID=A0AAE0U974_9PEZI|nr:hypothetical protein B0H63DRAFT_462827 [Podospora didyma]
MVIWLRTPVNNLFFLLHRYHADVNAKTKAGKTALQEAAKMGNESLVEWLVRWGGADVNAKTETGETALHWAADYGDVNVVQLLLKHDADVNARTERGETPLHWAIRNEHEEVKRLLCEHGAEPMADDPYTTVTAASKRAAVGRSGNATLWGVLIGIDTYREEGTQRLDAMDGRKELDFRNLEGCTNDISLAEQYLIGVMGVQLACIRKLVSGPSSQPEVEESNAPTYSNIIQALKDVTSAAAPGDAVYIHYSGIGSHEPTAFPTPKGVGGLDGVLVPTDIRRSGQYLRDFELEYLLRKMVDKGLVVTLVLDCQSVLPKTAFVGRQDVSPSYDISSSDHVPALSNEMAEWCRREARLNKGRKPFLEPKGYTLFATSNAHEYRGPGGKVYGVLSYHLLDLLAHGSAADLSCRALYRRLHAKMKKAGALRGGMPILAGEADRGFHGFRVDIAKGRSMEDSRLKD